MYVILNNRIKLHSCYCSWLHPFFLEPEVNGQLQHLLWPPFIKEIANEVSHIFPYSTGGKVTFKQGILHSSSENTTKHKVCNTMRN